MVLKLEQAGHLSVEGRKKKRKCLITFLWGVQDSWWRFRNPFSLFDVECFVTIVNIL